LVLSYELGRFLVSFVVGHVMEGWVAFIKKYSLIVHAVADTYSTKKSTYYMYQVVVMLVFSYGVQSLDGKLQNPLCRLAAQKSGVGLFSKKLASLTNVAREPNFLLPRFFPERI
jgi:hypothetical protein